jgi:outer membrane protein assembly factor BamA
MAGIDFDKLIKKIVTYDKEDIRESLERCLNAVDGRIDAYAIILCEDEEPPCYQVVAEGNGNLLADKIVDILEANPELNVLFTKERAERAMKRLKNKYNKK